MKIQFRYYFCIIFLIFTTGTVAYADTTKYLTWDVNDDADYYVVKYGTEDGNFSEVLWLGTSIKINLTELMADKPAGNYYFAVKAFNNLGNSSDFSESVYTFIAGNCFIRKVKIFLTFINNSFNNFIS